MLLLLPAGAVVALRPVLQPGVDGRRSCPIANMLIGALLVAAFLLIGFALGQEIYRCDVLGIPNCD